MDVLAIHPETVSKRGQNDRLVCGVPAVDIQRRIRLGVPGGLRFGERLGKAKTRLAHPGENVIAGPIDDAVNGPDMIGHERLADRFNDRHATGDRRLKEDRNVFFRGGLENGGAMLG